MHSPLETEVKIPIGEPAPVAQALETAGFALIQPREFESNTLYDTAARDLLAKNMLIRLRQSGSRFWITWKGPSRTGSSHKVRPEIETSIGSLEAVEQILGQLGYLPSFRYEKYRRIYQAAGAPGLITLDETPIGNFLELEGPGPWIDSTAARLGFSPSVYVLESYARLYLNHCARTGAKPAHMVFPSKRGSGSIRLRGGPLE